MAKNCLYTSLCKFSHDQFTGFDYMTVVKTACMDNTIKRKTNKHLPPYLIIPPDPEQIIIFKIPTFLTFCSVICKDALKMSNKMRSLDNMKGTGYMQIVRCCDVFIPPDLFSCRPPTILYHKSGHEVWTFIPLNPWAISKFPVAQTMRVRSSNDMNCFNEFSGIKWVYVYWLKWKVKCSSHCTSSTSFHLWLWNWVEYSTKNTTVDLTKMVNCNEDFGDLRFYVNHIVLHTLIHFILHFKTNCDAIYKIAHIIFSSSNFRVFPSTCISFSICVLLLLISLEYLLSCSSVRARHWLRTVCKELNILATRNLINCSEIASEDIASNKRSKISWVDICTCENNPFFTM